MGAGLREGVLAGRCGPPLGHKSKDVMMHGETAWRKTSSFRFFATAAWRMSIGMYAYSPVQLLSVPHIGCSLSSVPKPQKATKSPYQALRQELNRLGDLFQQAPAFFTVLRGPQQILQPINPLYQQLLGPRWSLIRQNNPA